MHIIVPSNTADKAVEDKMGLQPLDSDPHPRQSVKCRYANGKTAEKPVGIVVSNYVQKFFDTTPFKRWSLILLPSRGTRLRHLASNRQNKAEMTDYISGTRS